jgi:hypothetical protein
VSGNGRQSRKDQIIQWCGENFDGVIALDECHRAKKLGSTKSGCSKSALAVKDLQDELPLARVVYVSATGLAEPEDLACLSRLGLWGPGMNCSVPAAFPSRNIVLVHVLASCLTKSVYLQKLPSHPLKPLYLILRGVVWEQWSCVLCT